MPNYDYQDDDTPILVEITPLNAPSAGGHLEDTSFPGEKIKAAAAGVVNTSVDGTFKLIYRMAKRSGMLVRKLREEQGEEDLSKLEVEFAVKFNGGAEAFITVGAEANLSVKLTWERKP